MIDWLLSKICGDTLPSEDVIAWLFKTYGWLIRHEGGFDAWRQKRPLVLPTEANFPIRQNSGELLAQEVFGLVRKHLHMERWPCALVQQKEHVFDGMAGVIKGGISGAAGTFRMCDDDTALITYAPKLLGDVPLLITTLVHELCHYYLTRVPTDPPGGPDADEHATDATAIILGFGIFKANNVYATRRSVAGTSFSHTGYLGELPSSYALAIFTELHGVDPKQITPHLRPNPASYFAGSVRDLRKNKRWQFELTGLKQLRG